MAKAAKRKISALEKLARRLHRRANNADAEAVIAHGQFLDGSAARSLGRAEAYRSAANSVLRLVRRGGRGGKNG